MATRKTVKQQFLNHISSPQGMLETSFIFWLIYGAFYFINPFNWLNIAIVGFSVSLGGIVFAGLFVSTLLVGLGILAYKTLNWNTQWSRSRPLFKGIVLTFLLLTAITLLVFTGLTVVLGFGAALITAGIAAATIVFTVGLILGGIYYMKFNNAKPEDWEYLATFLPIHKGNDPFYIMPYTTVKAAKEFIRQKEKMAGRDRELDEIQFSRNGNLMNDSDTFEECESSTEITMRVGQPID